MSTQLKKAALGCNEIYNNIYICLWSPIICAILKYLQSGLKVESIKANNNPNMGASLPILQVVLDSICH
jgi:hypothetical protein